VIGAAGGCVSVTSNVALLLAATVTFELLAR
jgi:hypothetical protein